MSTYFRNFPLIRYKFGDDEAPVLFQNLTTYVDVLDTVADDANFYNKYQILSGDRPDVVSYKLYGTTNYYWTFFLLNKHIKESGWPISDRQLAENIAETYPHQVITVEDNIADTLFQIGATVEGNTSGSTGVIIDRNLDLGQMVISSVQDFANGEVIRTGTVLANQSFSRVYSHVSQQNSVHHYENTDGEYVDINPFDQTSTNGLIPITVIERYIAKNDELKSINVLRPQAVERISNEYQKLLRS